MPPSINHQITVTWRHQVHFTRGVFNADNALLSTVLAPEPIRRRSKVLIVLDESLVDAQPDLPARSIEYFKRHEDLFDLVAAPLVMQGGERIKNAYFHVSEIHSQIDRFHIDRQSYILCAGGGALLDMVGLAAATAHRGVRLVRLPSSTLAQADSGVGVKNGINAFGKKNFIGTFAPPFAVINDFNFLDSLSLRDKRAGYSEAVKVACLKDAAFFETLERLAADLKVGEDNAVEAMVCRCAELHAAHIAGSGDPFEFGSSRPLDFGHWGAHKLEQISEYRLRHGEAVAIGIALDALYSRLKGWLSERDTDRILNLLHEVGLPLWAPEMTHADAEKKPVIMRGLEEFREHLGGDLTITMLRGIGDSFEVHEMDEDLVLKAMAELSK